MVKFGGEVLWRSVVENAVRRSVVEKSCRVDKRYGEVL